MDFYSGLVDIRFGVALCTLLFSILFQMIILLVGFVLKKNIMPMPIAEIVLRPFLIKIIDKLNRSDRTDFSLIIRGLITFFVVFSVVCGVSYGVHHLMPLIGYPQYTHVILLFLILSPVMVLKTAYGVSVEKTMDGAYLQLSRTLNQNLIPADKHGLRRAGCKAMALSLTEYIIAPLLFYILGGVIGAYLYVSLSLFIRLSGQNSRAFTSVFLYIYRLMNFVASIVGVFFIFLSSLFATGGRPLKVLRAFKHPSIMVESAMAYAQNITLGGVYQTRLGDSVKEPWVGADGATAKLYHKDMLRVIIQYGITVFILTVVLLAIKIYT